MLVVRNGDLTFVGVVFDFFLLLVVVVAFGFVLWPSNMVGKEEDDIVSLGG